MLEYQAAAMQKLLEIGVELDEFIKHPTAVLSRGDDALVARSEISLTSLVFPSDMSMQNRIFMTDEDTVKSEVSTPDLEQATLSIAQCSTKAAVKAISVSSDDEKKKNKCAIFKKAKKAPAEVDESKKSVTKIDLIPLVKDVEKLTLSDQIPIIPNESHKSEEILPNTSNLSTQSDIGPDISLSQCNNATKAAISLDEKKVEANDSSSDASSATNKSNKKSSADISSSEEVSAKAEGKLLQEKLKSKKLMTRRDRFLQNVQRPEIPDLSFKPTNKVFDSMEGYITCPESSSSTSAIKINERKRKKKRVSEKEDVPSSNCVVGYGQPPEPYVGLKCLISHLVSPSEFYINYIDENIALIDTYVNIFLLYNMLNMKFCIKLLVLF